MKNYTLLFLALFGICQIIQAQEDKYQWLEEVDGQKALEFVDAQNKATVEELSAEKDYQDIYDKSLAIYNNVGDHVKCGQHLGDILIGSYCVVKIQKPCKIHVKVGYNLRGGISTNPIAEFM